MSPTSGCSLVEVHERGLRLGVQDCGKGTVVPSQGLLEHTELRHHVGHRFRRLQHHLLEEDEAEGGQQLGGAGDLSEQGNQ